MKEVKASVSGPAKALVTRQFFGLLIGLGSIVAITRIIGPADYGVYAATLAALYLAQTWSELSLDVYLVRKAETPLAHEVHAVFSILTASSIVVPVVFSLLPVILAQSVQDVFPSGLAMLMASSIAFINMQQIPLAFLERDLDYVTIGKIELASQFLGAAVGVILALLGGGYWAPAIGWCLQQLLMLVGYWLARPVPVRLKIKKGVWRPLLAYGFKATASTALYGSRNLVAPVIVGAAVGPSAVGYVVLANRLLEQASFLRSVVVRMAYRLIGRAEGDESTQRAMIERLVFIQVALTGLPCALLSLSAPLIVLWIFGEDWLPVVQLIPLLLVGTLLTALFAPLLAYFLGENGAMVALLANGANAAILWIFSYFFLIVCDFSLVGYAFADMLASVAWVPLLVFYLKSGKRLNILPSLSLLIGVLCVAFADQKHWWLVLVGLVFVVNPATWRLVRELLRLLRGPKVAV